MRNRCSGPEQSGARQRTCRCPHTNLHSWPWEPAEYPTLPTIEVSTGYEVASYPPAQSPTAGGKWRPVVAAEIETPQCMTVCG